MNSYANPYQFIAIEGNIGAGKTSLAKKIAKTYNAKLILEQFEDNSFLPKFYKDPDRYAFPLELSFLAERYQQLKETLGVRDLFKDFTVSDYFINKSLIFSRKTLIQDEFKLYSKLFDIMNQSIVKPELLVYLYADVEHLQKNISQRGREYEQEIKDDYLEQIQESYFDFIKHQTDMKILIINTNDLDFVNKDEDFELISSIIFKEYKVGIHRINP
jgi:deoxyadenosine/deoxycytidine kinase